jgi:anti-sigma regulatory factor (Ser/Thr protein kinase)
MPHKPNEIRQYLLERVYYSELSPIAETAKEFAISREAAYKHLRYLINENQIRAIGSGRSTTYKLVSPGTIVKEYKLSQKLEEDIIWQEIMSSTLNDLSSNESTICHYGFTEMVNNAIEHSGGTRLVVHLERTAISVTLSVKDNGLGIFNKITKALKLTDKRRALLELSKGKLTTDPKHHTGEGIFFTSRIFDSFVIHSDKLSFIHKNSDGIWQSRDSEQQLNGTMVIMTLLQPAKQKLDQLFNKFSSGPDEYRFSRTHVPLKLAQYGHDSLISRSQAKRVLTRFEKFDEILLDFAEVNIIGQAFADEIFRVFAKENPDISIKYTNANTQIKKMIHRALSNK